MNSYSTIFYLIGAFFIAVPLVYLAFKFRDRASDFESRLTGIWTNESKTLRILIHNIDSVFQGNVIWVDTNYRKEALLGATVIRDLELRVLAQGSSGIYVDPENGMELPFQLWLNGNGTIRLSVLSKIRGKNQVIKEEKWFPA